ncbi:MAG: hypothetical protein PWQ91_845 [Eubacteriales bacterium]|nr:hypothetical protein [Eubacteriales bacterium]MDN5363784.1 hypothetical protein [Eubacteriales bacterium]
MGTRKGLFFLLAGLVAFFLFSGCRLWQNGRDYLLRRYYGVKEGVWLEDVLVEYYLEKEVRQAAKNIALQVNRPPQNASIDRRTGEIIPEKPGLTVDVEATVRKVLQAEKGMRLKVVTRPLWPRWKREDIAALTREVGVFVTYAGGSEERWHNITLATCALDRTLIYPGEVMSFNRIVGPRTPERGYKNAPIMTEGGFFLGPGGGVCQVASTLYNAAVQAGLEVVERHRHARPVGYVPPGQDATVDFDSLDLKIKNNRPHPVLLRGEAAGRQVRFWFFFPAEEPPPQGR